MSATQRSTLLALTRSTSTPVRQLVRARALLLAADGVANDRIAADLALSATTVRSWRARFVADGLAQLGRVRPGQGAKQTISADTVRAIVHATTHTLPKDQPRWSCQAMAGEFGVSAATVYRIWRANGLKPHLVDTPIDARPADEPPPFGAIDDKVTDVVGVLLSPSARAFALCMDENSRLQAVDRVTQAVVIAGRRPEHVTHGGRRNSTTTLFAALDVLTRSVSTGSTTAGSMAGAAAAQPRPPRHRYEDFLRFLSTIDESVPQHLAVHLVLDNCITHQHADVQRWLDRHHRFHLLFAPTSDSWLALAENWLRGLADTAPRGSFNSVPGLIAAIEGAATSADSPAAERHSAASHCSTNFFWTTTADSVLGSVRGGHHFLQQAVGQ